MIANVTKNALDCQADVYKESVTKLLMVINEISLLLDAYHLRNGEEPLVDQMVREIIIDMKSQFTNTYQVLGMKMLDAINILPVEPHEVGFWEEIGARILDALFGNTPLDRDFLKELRLYSEAANRHISSVAKNTLDGIKDTLNHQSTKG